MKHHSVNPDACTACTVCVVNCPVAAATSKFLGPKMTGPALERMRLSQTDIDPSLDYCSNCKTCDRSCPSGVPVSTLNMLARARQRERQPQKLRDYILSHSEQMAKLSSSLPGMASLTNLGMTIGKSLGTMDMMGLAGKAPLPAYATRTFYQSFKKIKQTPYQDKVVYYPGCFINYNEPQPGLDFIAVMQKNKIEVLVDPDFVCCGSPLVVNGYLKEARQNADQNIALLNTWMQKGYPIVTGCPSCSLMFKQEYRELFPDISADRNYESAIYDSMEYLLSLHEEERFNTEFASEARNFIYHAPCHLKVQSLGTPAVEVLSLIPGMKIESADAGCCGMSGCYGFKSDKYDIAMKVGGALFQRIRQANPDSAVSDCGICRLQITHGSGAKALHPITIVNDAYQAADTKNADTARTVVTAASVC